MKQVMKASDITIIIPIAEYDETTEFYLSRAINSIKNADRGNKLSVNLIGPEEVLSKVKDAFPENKKYKKIINTGATDYSSQINFAVKECKTKYFSILEFDDEYTGHWFENVEKYSEYFAKIQALDENRTAPSVYLPLVEVYDNNAPGTAPMQYLNEAYWASSFSDTLGYFDNESLINYTKVNVFGVIFNGGVFDKEDFLSIGGLKPSIKLTFWHEFALRALQNNKNIYVVPKIGYNHYAKRTGSMSENYLETLSQKEIDWWVNLAEKEYFFKNDRNKTYEE